MSSQEGSTRTCEACGSTIYPQHIEKHLAGQKDGKLLCRHCLEESLPAGTASVDDSAGIRIALREPENPPLALSASEAEGGSAGASGDEQPRPTRSYTAGLAAALGDEKALQFRRPTFHNASVATRCRTFHCKLNDVSIGHMDRVINEWVDSDDDIEIKFATSTIGVFEGKHSDANLIITVFY